MASTDNLRTILVVHDGTDRGDAMVRYACDLTAPGGRVVALAVTEVHPSLPLNGLPADMDRVAIAALRRAVDVAGRSGHRIEIQLRRSRNLATATVLEARWLNAELILLPLNRPRLSWIPVWLSRTTRDVLRHAPCPVLVGQISREDSLKEAEIVAEAERLVRQAS